MENIKRQIDTYDLVEIQNLLDCYYNYLDSYREKDEFNEECRRLQLQRCDYLMERIEGVLRDEIDQ